MKVRRVVTLVGLFLIFLTCFTMYMKIADLNYYTDLKIVPQDILDIKVQNNLLSFQDYVDTSKIRSTFEIVTGNSCSFQVTSVPKIDLQMLDIYKNLKFVNQYHTSWQQGFKIIVNRNRWSKQLKLNVYIVPHSHNDPGWLQTFVGYYYSRTKHILNTMLDKLPEDPNRKFIWSEISFFAMWWEELNLKDQETIKRLIRNNQLEFVTGGWVMNDEANSHWISILHQFSEGHQWLKLHLNYTPTTHLSIDSFGLSATQPMLLKRMGLENMVIQRAHYAIKEHFAQTTNLEFRWRQFWGISEELLNQFRKKAMLFKTNVLLVPLGNDFTYSTPAEFEIQFQNFEKLIDFMNTNEDMKVQVQFGTLSDYFNAVRSQKSIDNFPSLSGDFFTYADKNQHYWSGYFTSRAFYKRMDRELLSYIRTAEIILTLAHLNKKPGLKLILSDEAHLLGLLSKARKALALFQHHDAITGTSRKHVMADYGKGLFQAIKETQKIIEHCTTLLLLTPLADMYENSMVHYSIDEVRYDYDSLPEQNRIGIEPGSSKKIVLFNSLLFSRQEIVSFTVSTPFIKVVDFKGRSIDCQVLPIFEFGSLMSNSKFIISFIADVPALGLTSYSINALLKDEISPKTVHSSIKIFNQHTNVTAPPGFSKIYVSLNASEFTIKNHLITAAFNCLGLLKAVTINKYNIPVLLDFVEYKTKNTSDKSGPYLFIPNGDATPIQIKNTIVKVIEGPLLSTVVVELPYVQHTVTLFNSPGADGLGLEIQNLVDISSTSNFEIAMRLSTNISSTDNFFTDLNGYQIIRRKFFRKLPLQGNYYPMSTMAYIEDTTTRLSILTSTPLGCASLNSGQIEIMLDRKLDQDDRLGMGQGITDNLPTRHIFKVILERKVETCKPTADDHPAGFPSLSAHVASQSLLNPVIRLYKIHNDDVGTLSTYSPVTTEFGVDFTLPSLRNDVVVDHKYFIGITLHRQHLDVCFVEEALFQRFPLSQGSVNVSAILPQLEKDVEFNKATLSFLYVQERIKFQSNISLCPMDMQAFVLFK